jgi:spermidine/putrescine transport system substrate-binding protein
MWLNKRFKHWMSCVLLCGLCPVLCAQQQVVNLYTYSAYFPPKVLAQFERETGIHVNVSIIYGDNRVLFAKLKAMPTPSYDLAVITNYSLPRFAKAQLIAPLNPAQIPQAKHITPHLMQAINPSSAWTALPFAWCTTGILVNTRLHPANNITHWRDLWSPAYHQQLLLIDDMRDVMAMGLMSLQHSPSSRRTADLQQLKQKLLALRPNIRLFSSDNMINLYVDEDISVGMSWSGDAYLAQKANPALKYIYPKEGFGLWIDSIAMVNHAPHPQAAYRFLNFLCRPDVAKQIMVAQGIAIANQDAIKQLPINMQNNQTFNPSANTMKRAKLYMTLGDTQASYEKLWQTFKLHTALRP